MKPFLSAIIIYLLQMSRQDLSYTEENYLKAIYHLASESEENGTSTSSIAQFIDLKPATVTDMLRKLKAKKLIDYKKYGKVRLTDEGRGVALHIIRKHRLWEVFLYEKLGFSWDEVHEVAEQLEHIKSPKLINSLEKFLGYPEYDPHGDPIPSKEGEIKVRPKKPLSEMEAGANCRIVNVKDTSAVFLQYLMQLEIGLSTQIEVLEKVSFDNSMRIRVGEKELSVSEKFAENVLVI